MKLENLEWEAVPADDPVSERDLVVCRARTMSGWMLRYRHADGSETFGYLPDVCTPAPLGRRGGHR